MNVSVSFDSGTAALVSAAAGACDLGLADYLAEAGLALALTRQRPLQDLHHSAPARLAAAIIRQAGADARAHWPDDSARPEALVAQEWFDAPGTADTVGTLSWCCAALGCTPAAVQGAVRLSLGKMHDKLRAARESRRVSDAPRRPIGRPRKIKINSGLDARAFLGATAQD